MTSCALRILDTVPSLGFFDRVAFGQLQILLGHLDELLVVRVKGLNVLLSKVLDID